MPTALVLTAHGDDMEFTAGGTIAKLCMRGWDVHLLMATDNARGTFELSAEEMFGLRLKEAQAAANVRFAIAMPSWFLSAGGAVAATAPSQRLTNRDATEATSGESPAAMRRSTPRR